MTTIHMDVNAMRRIQHSLSAIPGQIQNKVMPLRRNHQGLSHDWVANSANEYFDYYADFDRNIARLLNRLNDLAAELSSEIARWEQMDKGFGD